MNQRGAHHPHASQTILLSASHRANVLHPAQPCAGKKHGYAILKDVEALSNGKVSLNTSALYGALGRLLDQGLIERVPNEQEENTGPGLPRKAYILSETGRRVLEAETDRLQSLVAVAHLRLGEEHT
jgi:DNA-binding PadR family transcriptional regulator